MTDMRTLAALDGEHRCGPDLEYDPEFLEMETLARGKKEQQFGDTLVAAEGPAWKALLECCESLNSRTRDLRVLVNHSRSLTALRGVAGAALGFALLRGLVEAFWDDLHPKLDADDDNDPTMRLNTFAALVGAAGDSPEARSAISMPELRSAVWITAKGIPCTVKQALGTLVPANAHTNESSLSEGELRSMIIEAAKLDPQNHARDAQLEINRLGQLLNDQVGIQRAPDFRPLSHSLKQLADFFDRVTGNSAGQSASNSDGNSAGDGTNDGGSNSGDSYEHQGVGMRTGAIRNRGDAIEILDRVCQYLETQEPSHPAPLLIRRAQRLLDMNFLDIVKDMAPEALASIENLAGSPRNITSE
jgi:type VI secretion system protein ImpA